MVWGVEDGSIGGIESGFGWGWGVWRLRLEDRVSGGLIVEKGGDEGLRGCELL